MTDKRVYLLDCTLRDGGEALEAAAAGGASGLAFSKNDMNDVTLALSRSNIDFVDIGSVEMSGVDKRNMAIYPDIESISGQMPKSRAPNQTYVAHYRGPDTPLSDIPDHNTAYCDVCRLVLRYSELKKSLDFGMGLSKKGYQVFLQPMVTMRYKNDELRLVIDAANDMSASALYFVDTYGYMREQDVRRFFSLYDKNLNPSIKIGFHAHNNYNEAFSNARALIEEESEREIIVDSCCLGMGQGAGNLPTEIITAHMNEYYGANYDYDAVLAACEIIDKYCAPSLWGYSLTRFLPAMNRTAYKFSVALREKYKLSFAEIHGILRNIPEEYRHRYTPAGTKELLKIFGYADRA